MRERAFATSEVVEQQLRRFTDIEPVARAMLGLESANNDLTAGFRLLSPENAALSWWLDLLREAPARSPAQRWAQMYDVKLAGNVSRRDAVEWGDLLRCALEGYLNVLSPQLGEAISRLMRAIPDRNFPFFADTPMAPMWIETAVNQLGSPHHANVEEHRRYSYKAKTREMCLDVFVFDRCRSFYNWLPLPELYGDDLTRFGRQVVARLCLDAIAKQTHEIVPYSLRYASVVPKYSAQHKGFNFAYLRRRQIIKSRDATP